MLSWQIDWSIHIFMRWFTVELVWGILPFSPYDWIFLNGSLGITSNSPREKIRAGEKISRVKAQEDEWKKEKNLLSEKPAQIMDDINSTKIHFQMVRNISNSPREKIRDMKKSLVCEKLVKIMMILTALKYILNHILRNTPNCNWVEKQIYS